MKAFKLKKKHYTDLEQLNRDAGLVEGNSARPSDMYVNSATYKKMKKEMIGLGMKKRTYSKRDVIVSVGFAMLNLAPAINEGVKDGWVVVKE